jgi:hypothetical protein
MKRPDASKRMKENNPMKNRNIVKKMLKNRDVSGKKNPNYKGGKIKKNCLICNNIFEIFPSASHIKTCSTKCANISRSINSSKTNLGKNKSNCEYMKRISEMKKGVKRTKQEKENISKGTIKGMKKNWDKFIEGNKNRDLSFLKDPKFYDKVNKTKSKNIFSGKYIYKNIKMRSNWEVAVAKYLDSIKIKWEYEPKTFYLNDINICYTPDFYLPEKNIWIEVKGYFSERSQLQCYYFKKEYIKELLIYDEKILKELNIL